MDRLVISLASLVSLVVLAPPVGCSAEDPERAAFSRSPIVGGEPAGTGPSAVLQLGVGGVCTGTLVAPNLVLTAKHCVADAYGAGYDCDENGNVVIDTDAGVYSPNAGQFGDVHPLDRFTVGRSGTDPLAPRVARVLVAPAGDLCKTDLAFLVLDRNVDDPVLAPIRIDASATVGEHMTATGWGYTHDKTYATTLERRSVEVLAVGPAAATRADASAPAVEALPIGFFSVSLGLCYGDSGSPAIAASGAVVGVASGISAPSLVSATGSAADCATPDGRGIYRALAADRDFIASGFVAANATPWIEGTPDPRAGLAPFAAACARDEDCLSNACVADDRGASRCSHGCLESKCPTDYACAAVAGRKRCVALAAPVNDGGVNAALVASGGCSAGSRAGSHGSALLIAVAALAAQRRARRRGRVA